MNKNTEFNTRTGRGEDSAPPHIFPEYLKNGCAQRRRFLSYLPRIQWHIFCKNFDLIGPKLRSPGQVKFGTSPRHRHLSSRSRCEHSFSPNDLKLSGNNTARIPTKHYLGLIIFLTCGQVIFLPAPIIRLWENTFFAYHFWTKCDRQMKIAPICLTEHSKSNEMQHGLFWPDLTSDLRSNFDLNFLRSNLVSCDLSWGEEHNGGKMVALDR